MLQGDVCSGVPPNSKSERKNVIRKSPLPSSRLKRVSNVIGFVIRVSYRVWNLGGKYHSHSSVLWVQEIINSRRQFLIRDHYHVLTRYNYMNVLPTRKNKEVSNCVVNYVVVFIVIVHSKKSKNLLGVSFPPPRRWNPGNGGRAGEQAIALRTIPSLDKGQKGFRCLGDTSEKGNMVTSSGSTCSVYLEGTKSQSEGRVPIPACYLLL